MIKNFLKEYNEEFDNSIQPNQILENENRITLVYREISKYEIEQIEKFCNIYNLNFDFTTSHNELFYTITNF